MANSDQQFGIISGGSECQDLPFIEQHQEKIHDSFGLSIETAVGECKVAGNEIPGCPAQQVPGYR